ncbi:MAG TPA: hypothetical protein VMH87_12265 [Pseudomonadales bacterium]|nr:hypothetical protein [Pseudomonadales bacterium]
MSQKHPDGSVQALSSAAIGQFAIMIAFIGYTCYGAAAVGTNWRAADLLFLIPAALSCLFLAAVPWRATQKRDPEDTGKSIDAGRCCLVTGTILMFVTLLIYFIVSVTR